MNCPQCQTRIEDTANFCHECGTKARMTAPPVVASAPGQDEQQAAQLVTQARDLLSQNDADGALYAAQAAIALTPDAAAPHMLLGEVFQHQGRLSEAAAQFEVTLRLDPGNLQAAQHLDAVRSQPVPAAASSESRRMWSMAGMAFAGVAVLAGGFALISSAAKPADTGRSHSTSVRVGAPLSPTHIPTGLNQATVTPTPSATLKPASAPTGTPAAPIRTTPTPSATLSRARPAVPGYTAGTPAIRVGLPPVVNSPATPNVPTLGPAVPRTLVPAPVSAANVGAPGGERPQDPRVVTPGPQPGVTAQPNGYPPSITPGDQRYVKKTRRGEPIEPDTGFIRIEPANRGEAPADGVPPQTGANPDGTGITIPLNRR